MSSRCRGFVMPAHHLYIGYFFNLIAKNIELINRVIPVEMIIKHFGVYGDDGIFIETHILIQHKMDLFSNHQRADNKYQGNGKLKYNERFPKIALSVKLLRALSF